MTTLTTRPQGWLLGWWRYGRCWARSLTACHLTTRTADTITVPERLRVDIGVDIDSVLVRMLPGQCPADWHSRTLDLAAAFGADHCRAELIGPATVELLFLHADSLLEGPEIW